MVAVAQRGRRRKLPAPVRADQRLTYGITVIVKDDCIACGAATAQPGLGFLGNLIGINRISVAVSYADNAGSGRGLGINGNRKIGRKRRGVAVTVAGRHGKGVGVVRQWRGRGVSVAPDAGITDDNICYPGAILIQVYCGTRFTCTVNRWRAVVSEPQMRDATENTWRIICNEGDYRLLRRLRIDHQVE